MPKNTHNKTIAIFGGTFDPPHIGHILPLQETADKLRLTNIRLMPANIPALKQGVTAGHHRLEMTKLLCDIDPRFSIDLTEFEISDTSYTVNTLKHIKKAQPEQSIAFIVGLDSLLSLRKWHQWEALFDYCHLVVMLRPTQNHSATDKLIGKTHSIEDSLQRVRPNEVALKLNEFYTTEDEFNAIVGDKLDRKTHKLLIPKLANALNTRQSINQDSFQDIIGNSAQGKLWFVKNEVFPVSSTAIRQQIKSGEDIDDIVPQTILDYINKHQLYK